MAHYYAFFHRLSTSGKFVRSPHKYNSFAAAWVAATEFAANYIDTTAHVDVRIMAMVDRPEND
jgi:hypothetical protein